MSILLDSHALLWALHAPAKLIASARAAIRDTRLGVYFSAASAWELEIKIAKGKLTMPAGWLAAAEAAGLIHVPVTAEVAQASARLPWHHSDPFDRLLVAQAAAQGWRIATRDLWISAYDVQVLAC